ncbi:hypothetical protein MSMEI_6116 [Mycolicibacterium smegmatis MC2 155]|uniref:Uncharacterized protein n=1 Tax=Mycolicibacterium smegmatis (strain ATCC 700084 / mc(2)155) TaxID=246196 RepID=I7GAH1_MYCS2|nr:hypothetical protein MSMEI_6116 [Mycolicibacterium smegmatis MC2 155]
MHLGVGQRLLGFHQLLLHLLGLCQQRRHVGRASGLHHCPLAVFVSRLRLLDRVLVSTWLLSPVSGGLAFQPSPRRGYRGGRASPSLSACRRRGRDQRAHRGDGIGRVAGRPCRPLQHRRNDRVPRSRPQRGQRRVDRQTGAHGTRRHQELPGERHRNRRRLSRTQLHVGHHAAGAGGTDGAGRADRDVTRQRQRAGTVRRRARRDGQLAASARHRVDPRRRRSAHGSRLPRAVLVAAAERRAVGPVGAVREGHARSAGRVGDPPGHLHRAGRAQSPVGHRGPEPGAVPVGAGRVRQHEEPRRLRADEIPGGASEVRRRHRPGHRRLPGLPVAGRGGRQPRALTLG